MTTPASADDVLAGLDPEQLLVASRPTGPMCVLAGAGTGKTRAITHRIAYGVWSGAYAPHQVLAVTFTARAAGEIRSRLRALGVPGVPARTFHAAALRQLHYFWPQVVGGAPPDVMAHKAAAVAEAASRLRLRLDRTVLRDLASEIEWAKVNMLPAGGYPAAAARERRQVTGLDSSAVTQVMEVYETVKEERNAIDFEDVLLLTIGMLADNERVTATVREQYRHFVVDEYQDVNRVQQQLLELWLGGRADVCVVGDPAQTIYSFTGASPRHLLDFPSRHPGSEVIRLVRNYRSTPQIVQLANLVLGGHPGAGDLRSQTEPGPRPELTPYADDAEEAAGVATSIAAALAGGRPASEVAVLFRTNAQSEAIESALAAAGISYLVRGGERFFSRPEVRQGLVLLRGAVRSDDPSRPLGEAVRDVLTAVGWSPQQPTSGATRERWESLQALTDLADDLAAVDPGLRIGGLVAELDRRASEQHAPTVQGVTLASLHAAKGLEWDVVHLIGCSEGLLPITLADDPASLDEERRLLYVGLTRARRVLRLSWATARGAGGRGNRRPSRFLRPAGHLLGLSDAPASVPDGAATAARRAPRRPRTCRTCNAELTGAAQRKVGRCSSCPPTYDEPTFEALRQWRLELAKHTGAPAYVVFTDATLTAIAEKTPASLAELGAIPGVGPRKLEAYGLLVLRILAEHSRST